jgi:hypothetical protein
MGHRDYWKSWAILLSGIRFSSASAPPVVLAGFLYLPASSQRLGLGHRSIFHVWLDLREHMAMATSHVWTDIYLARLC